MIEGQIKDSYYVEFNQKIYDIQRIFVSLCVVSVKGIEDLGKTKTIISEDYAESNELRVFAASNPTFKPTKVSMEIAFIGEKSVINSEQKAFTDMLNSNPYFTFADTYRKRKARLLFDGGLKLSKDYRVSDSEQGSAVVYKYSFTCTYLDDTVLTENELCNYDMKAIKNINEYENQ